MKKKEMIPLTKEEKKTHRRQKKCHICQKTFSTDDNNKKYHKVKDHCITLENTEALLIIFAVQDIKHQKKFQ